MTFINLSQVTRAEREQVRLAQVGGTEAACTGLQQESRTRCAISCQWLGVQVKGRDAPSVIHRMDVRMESCVDGLRALRAAEPCLVRRACAEEGVLSHSSRVSTGQSTDLMAGPTAPRGCAGTGFSPGLPMPQR